jgi:3-phenylpropionate/trans-cinnamate dioxygenase ferredoxin subunit
VTTIAVCSLDQLAPDSSARFDVAGHRVALVRIGDDVYAIGDRCSHADVSLAEGEIDAGDKSIECWKHGSSFSLETGQPNCLPATKPVPVYDVTVEDGQISIVVNDGSTT